MASQPLYLIATNNLSKFLETLRHAQAPEKVSLKFIEELGFKSTNDRLFVRLLKAMEFTDDTGKPTSRYHSFLDDTEWKRVLADGIRDAYADLFRINRNANMLPKEQLTGKLKSIGEGKLSEPVLRNAVKTFTELVKLADFSSNPDGRPAMPEPLDQQVDERPTDDRTSAVSVGRTQASNSLIYRIEIVLPATRDQAIYDAIFRSLRNHLPGS